MVIAVSLLVALVGALMYAFAANPKLMYMGLVMFGTGLLAFLLRMAGHAIGVLPQ